jgi:arylsulfatase A
LPAPHTPIVPVPPYRDASKMNPYADFMMQVDGHMGELFAAIKEAGVDENTLVFFTSDNGCSNQANFEKLAEFGHDPSAGFRGHKADIYEGGHRVPLIVRWPAKIKEGRDSSALVCLTDLYATLQEITGQPKKDDGGEDSFSLLPVFEGKKQTRRKTLVSHSINGSFAIRKGDWKLCLTAGSGGWSRPKDDEAKAKGLPSLQLYNLKEDKGERNNLQAKAVKQTNTLLLLLNQQVQDGRSTPGNPVPNDRKVSFLPKGVTLPQPQ